MKISEILTEDILDEVEVAWGRSRTTSRGGQPTLKFRCTSGPRKSRLVSSPAKCHQPMDVAQAQKMKTTRARTAPTQSRRQTRTKSINTASRLISKLNKYR
jgi:hypothetical protein